MGVGGGKGDSRSKYGTHKYISNESRMTCVREDRDERIFSIKSFLYVTRVSTGKSFLRVCIVFKHEETLCTELGIRKAC